MGTLQKIVKVTQQQYDSLKNGGTIGGYTGINSNYIYLVQEDYADITYANLNSTASIGTIGSSKIYPIGLDNDNKLAVYVPWTWQANSASYDGYVTKGQGQAAKVWKTDANGNPAWRGETDTTNTAGTSSDNENQLYLIGASSKSSLGVVTHTSDVYMMSNNLYANAFYASSDRRLKENIKDLDLNCLDLVNNINLREFSWKADEEHKPVIGAVAQELKKALPEKYVHEFIGGREAENEYLSINDSKLVYLLIGAIQEQQKEIESLKAKIDNNINQ